MTARQLTNTGTPFDHALMIDIKSDNVFFGSYFYFNTSINPARRIIPPGSSDNYFDIPISIAVNNGQPTAIPGTYTSAFQGNHTGLAIDAKLSTPADCTHTPPSPSNTFDFVAIATVPNFCEFTTSIQEMAFPITAGISEESQSARTDLSVRCTNTTPYTITLLPSNNNVFGQGEMTAVDALGQVDTVPYALYQDSSGTTAWGGLPDNGLSHVGTGNIQRWTVLGVIPANLNVTPGTYRDNVIVSVSY